MSWDESLVDPTRAPADALIIRSPGGRTGNLSLENGQVLSFPWKRQQQIAGTRPGSINVFDDASTEYLDLKGPTLVPGADKAFLYLAGWDDGTASVGMSNGEVNLFLASGALSFSGGLASFQDGILVYGPETNINSDPGEDIQLISGGKIRLDAVEEIRLTGDAGIVIVNDSITGTDITIQSNRDILLNVDRDCIVTSTVGDFIADVAVDINLLANANWLAEGATMGLQTLTGDIVIDSADDITLTGTGGTLSVNDLLAAWVTTHVPVLTQSGTVTKTVIRSAYKKIGRTVIFEFYLDCTGSGTASNAITVSLPFTAVANTYVVGSFFVYDATAGALRVGAAALASTTTVGGVLDNSVGLMGASGMTNALVSTGSVRGKIIYEATS